MGAGTGCLHEQEVRMVEDEAKQGGKNWLEAREIETLPDAIREISRLRDMMHRHIISTKSTIAGGYIPQSNPRAAVMDKLDMDPASYERVVVPKSETVRRALREVIQQNILFKHCKEAERDDIVDRFHSREVEAGTTIIRQGDRGDHFFILTEGKVDVLVSQPGGDQVKVASVEQLAGFGELALLYNTPRAASVAAASDVTLWAIDRMTFRMIITYHQMVRIDKYVGYVQRIVIRDRELGAVLTKDQVEQIAGALETETFEEGDMIIRQGNTGDYFYIIEEGRVGVSRSEGGVEQQLAQLGPGCAFGEKALLSEDKRAASCTALVRTQCLTLGREDFNMMMGNLNDLLDAQPAQPDRPNNTLQAATSKLEAALPMRTTEDESSTAAPSLASDEEASSAGDESGGQRPAGERGIQLTDLSVLGTLGRGAFGRVKLCQHKTTGQTYALKCQALRTIVDNGLQAHILGECRILRQLDSPFILSIHAALADDRYVYFVLELLLGGELFTHLRFHGKFTNAHTKVYAAQVLLAFLHMHQKHIAYRDLKPENLVLDSQGYVKVVDFGLAKVVEGKTWTLCGTPDYLAPEIILNEGHNKAVDFWALGVLIFELASGAPPFFAEEPMQVYENILCARMTVPGDFPRTLADIVRKLLKIYQTKRLGNGKGGCKAVFKHKWFDNFDWHGLKRKAIEVPIVPKVADPTDTNNFENFDRTDPEQLPEPCLEWEPNFDA